MIYLHVDIQDETNHSAESIALAKCVLQTQYELLNTRRYASELCKYMHAIESKMNSRTMLAPQPYTDLGRTTLDDLRKFASVNLPGFAIQLEERKS